MGLCLAQVTYPIVRSSLPDCFGFLHVFHVLFSRWPSNLTVECSLFDLTLIFGPLVPWLTIGRRFQSLYFVFVLRTRPPCPTNVPEIFDSFWIYCRNDTGLCTNCGLKVDRFMVAHSLILSAWCWVVDFILKFHFVEFGSLTFTNTLDCDDRRVCFVVLSLFGFISVTIHLNGSSFSFLDLMSLWLFNRRFIWSWICRGIDYQLISFPHALVYLAFDESHTNLLFFPTPPIRSLRCTRSEATYLWFLLWTIGINLPNNCLTWFW